MKRQHFNQLTAFLCLCLLLIAFGIPAARADGTAQDITKQCAFKVSEGERGKLTDTNVRTTWSYDQSGAWIGVKLPDGVEAGWLRIEWMFDPAGFELLEFDASMTLLRQRNQSDTFPNIYTVFELLPEAKYLQLQMTAKGQEVCTVKVYSRGTLPAGVQLWEPPVEKADLMVVSTHQDDELVFMGGTIPYYATALKKPVIVVYMANCTRYRRNEALNSLWVMGVRNYPEFINLQDKRVSSISEGVELWGGKDNILSLLVERIRRFKPEVIVTHDLDGEYGHNQHKITARAMMYAIDAAADPERYPESAQRYGAWQVKKLYHHLYAENELMMDWETPLDSLNGNSPLKVAQIGMEEQASQLKYYRVKSHGTYDNAKYGLYFTTVGPDVAKNDFLENIDPNASANYLAEHGDEIARSNAEAQAARQAAAEAGAAGEEVIEDAVDGEVIDDDAVEGEIIDDAIDDTLDDTLDDMADDMAYDAIDDTVEAAVDDNADSPSAVEAPVADATEAPAEAPAEPAPRPAAGQVPPSNERSGSALPAIALVAAGLALLGGGGGYVWRMQSRRRHRRRRRR